MTPEPAAALGPDDYAALQGLLVAGDPQGLALAKKLTPTEQQAFFDYQKTANAGKGERTRTDNSVLGLPPELAVTAAVPVARAVAGAGASLASKAAAAAGAVAPQVAAQAKYWTTKTALEKMGVPSLLAEAAAVAVSGLRKGGKTEPAGAASTVPPAGVETAQEALTRPVATGRPAVAPAAPPPPAAIPPTIGEAAQAPMSVAPAAAPSAPTSTVVPFPAAAATPAAMSPQQVLNELAIQARRAGIKLTDEMEQTAIAAVRKGATPADAIKAVATPPAAAPAAVTEPPVWTPTKIRLTADESKLAAKLIQQGKTDQEVQTAIETARAFQKRFGTPTPTAAETRFAKGRR